MITVFNSKDEKPEKILKRLAGFGALEFEPDAIAKFMHKNIDVLSSVKIGEMIGSHN